MKTTMKSQKLTPECDEGPDENELPDFEEIEDFDHPGQVLINCFPTISLL
jgi:hypothetical protein